MFYLKELSITKEEILKLVNSREYHKLRAGETHRFIDISIVVAEGRLFVRQYSFSKRSWYHAFQEDLNGAIKCGDVVIKIKGVIPADLETINPKVNDTYLKKYGELASMMLGPQYMDSTLELIPIIDE